LIIPSHDAIEWGRRQAGKSPKWNAEKWQQVAAIFQVVVAADQADDIVAEAAQTDARLQAERDAA
jgi:hypothetical protein